MTRITINADKTLLMTSSVQWGLEFNDGPIYHGACLHILSGTAEVIIHGELGGEQRFLAMLQEVATNLQQLIIQDLEDRVSETEK